MPSPPRPAGAARRLVLAAVLVLSTGDLIWTVLLLPWSTSAREVSATELPAGRDTALVLACTVDRHQQPTRQLEGRLDAARGLFVDGKVRRLLVSGGGDETASMRRWLLAHGVPAEAIVADDASSRTFDSIKRARQVFGLSDPVIVTSDYHLPRALWLAGAVGMDARGVPASTARFGRVTRGLLGLREYLARNRAILDVLFAAGR
jgi:vancomycin permeability regulator SanA